MGHLHRVETQGILCLGLSEEALLNISEFLPVHILHRAAYFNKLDLIMSQFMLKGAMH